METLRKLFSRGRKQAAPAGESRLKPSKQLTAGPVTLADLKTLVPIRKLPEEELQAFASSRESEVYGPGSILFDSGEENQTIIYLLAGEVEIETIEHHSYRITGDSTQAHFPLTNGDLCQSRATAITDIRILRVSRKMMTTRRMDVYRPVNEHLESCVPELGNIPLFQAFSNFTTEENLPVPGLPEIAMRLRKAMQDEIGAAEASAIIQLDPVMTAKLVKVANSPLYAETVPVTTCLQAINRLGLNATRTLVTSFSLKPLYSSDRPKLTSILQKSWKKSLYLGHLCHVLASDNQIPPEEALLAGLINDIGIIPFLIFVRDCPENLYTPEELQLCLDRLAGPLGAALLGKWDFPAELAAIPAHANDWLYHEEGPLSLTETVILSRLHLEIGTGKGKSLPPITSIPACNKLRNASLTRELTLKVLQDARQRIDQALKVF